MATDPAIKQKAYRMLAKRILSAAVFIPACLLIVIAGGWLFILSVSIVLGVAAWEFWHMFRQGNYSPSSFILIGGTMIIVITRAFNKSNLSLMTLSSLIFLAMAYHTFNYEKGATTAGIDFCITVGGLMYVGWLGSYLILLRTLPEGLFWIVLSILGVGCSDIGAFLIGSKLGKHKISKRVSPSKSLEGYLGGVASGALFGLLFGTVVQNYSANINGLNGLIIGMIVSLVALLGDLGESMLKRQFDLKDTSQLIPGHGGILDRIDTWLWAAAISYYMITFFWVK